ncbi:MAG TPA: hypothetical protein VH835_11845, partial [Dongiaceae bacterium]
TVVAQVVVVLLAAGLLLSAAGCGGSPGGPANEDVARTSLTAALDAWKGGGKPADLRQRSPEIVMGDTFWEAGRKLANYKIDGPGKTGPKAWRVPVTLTLQAAGNKTETVKLIYIVTTDPAITIFQDAPE